MGQLWVTVDGDELANLTSGLDVAAAAVKDADERLEHAGATLARLGLTPEAGLATFDHLADAVVEARSCAGRLGLALSGRARSLRHALREYDGAERLPALLAAAAAVPGPQGWGVGLAGAALIGTESLLFSGGTRMRGLWTVLLTRGTGVAPFGGWFARTISPHLGPNPLGDLADAADLAGATGAGLGAPLVLPLVLPLGDLATLLRRLDARIDVDPPVAGATTSAGGVADLASRIAVAYDVPEGVGAVDVQRIEHAGGGVSWTVSVPGTQGFGLALGSSTVPMAGDVNATAYLGLPGPPDALVLAAMDQAGIQPGDPVVLAGHSLAGMVVMRLATTPSVTDRYSVAAVVTFGAPVGHLRAGKVPALHVRHAEDGTPSLSGVSGSRPGGPAAGEVVVVKELGEAGPDLSSAHAITTYAETAREIEASGHPGLSAWEQATKDLWAREGDRVTSSLHTGRVTG